MSVKFVDLYTQYVSIKAEIDEAIETVIHESAFIRGRHVDAFEKNYAELLRIGHCISCANGTDALYIALRTLGIGPGDEVIVPPRTFMATASSVAVTRAL